mmetsp:Transcript_595/g.1436  ORF Transcript_595/g.1436 Transcript_595/m.1436 type:complete len:310 (-) Transcript_595:232-1161(-)
MNSFSSKTGFTSEGQQDPSFPSHCFSSSSAQWPPFPKPQCQQVSADIISMDHFSPYLTASHTFHESSEKDPNEAFEHSNFASSLASPPPFRTPKYQSERENTSSCMNKIESKGTLRLTAKKIAISSLPLPRPFRSALGAVKPMPRRPLERQPSKIDSPIRLAPAMRRDIEGASSRFPPKDCVHINYNHNSNGESTNRTLAVQVKVKRPIQRTVPVSLNTTCTKNVVEKKTARRESAVDNQIIDMMGTMVGEDDGLDECSIDYNEIIGDIIGDTICKCSCPEPRESEEIELEVIIHLKSRKRRKFFSHSM